MVTTSKEKMVGKLARKWKNVDTIAKVSENNKNNSRKKAKEKERRWAKKNNQEGKNLLE